MKSLLFLVVALAIGAYAESDVKLDEGVLVLTKDNYQQVITENEHVLVEFYAPWCGHCKALAPEYAKAAQKLDSSGSAIKLGKVDATEETELAEQNAIRGYPTLKFYRNGKPIDYNGGRTADEIIGWLNKKTGPAAKSFDSVEDLDKFINDEAQQSVVVGFFKSDDSDAAKAFLKVAADVDDYQFALVTTQAVFDEKKITTDTVTVFKKFDEGRNDLSEEFTEENIAKFIKVNSLPHIINFDHETAQKIFGGDIKSHVLLFLGKDAGDFDKYVTDDLKALAKENKEKILFVTINADDEDHGRILEFFGMKKDEVPTVRIIQLGEEMHKYKPSSNVLDNTSDLKKFVSDFFDGNLKQHLLSQALPEDWDKNPVKVLVAENFDQVVFDKEKDVLVEFYAPWCGHCKQLAPIYDKLAEKFEEDNSVVVAKIDATVNELEHTKINSFPTIKLYKKGDNKVLDYVGPRTLESLEEFLKEGGQTSDKKKEKVEEEDEDDDQPKKDEL